MKCLLADFFLFIFLALTKVLQEKEITEKYFVLKSKLSQRGIFAFKLVFSSCNAFAWPIKIYLSKCPNFDDLFAKGKKY